MGQVAMMVTDRLIALPRRAKFLKELPRERPYLTIAVVAQVITVQRKQSTILEPYETPELLHIGITTARGQGHHGTLFEGVESKMARNERIEHAERIEERTPPQALEPIAAADVSASRRHVTIAVHDQHRRLLEGRREEDGCVCVVVADIDNLRQSCQPDHAAQVKREPEWEKDDATVLCGVRAWPEQRQTRGQPAEYCLGKSSPQLSDIPGRGDYIEVADAKAQRGEGRFERQPRELLRVLLAAE